MNSNWKKKLTSRKFWLAITAFVALLIVALGGSQETATRITALIIAGASVFAYIIGEGLVDAASVATQSSSSDAIDNSNLSNTGNGVSEKRK
ncbi:MAG: hypothetical protein ABF904_12235 [Ethanoligenens sp.]